jgi:putative flavoprotein involved in K+ transport
MGSSDVLDAVVIGAGWAGLGVSQALASRGIRHRVLERARICETWRTQRWDSFHINTPNSQTLMPGDTYGGPDPDGAMTCGEFIAMLENYARRHRLPVETNTAVTALEAHKEGYALVTPRSTLLARNVVIATGDQNCPVRPQLAAALPSELQQLDACDYRHPDRLESGSVLVVGSAQSGGQIAEDLLQNGRRVFLSTSRVGRLPRLYRGSHMIVWMVRTGLLDVTRQEMLQKHGRIAGRPLTGALHTISLQSLSAQGAVLLGRLSGAERGKLYFDADAEQNVRFADEASINLRAQVDEFIKRAAIEAPQAEPDPAEEIPACLPDPPIRSLELTACGIRTVIWCTGFKGDFTWVRVPGLLDRQSQPAHENGVAKVPGIYFAGLSFAVSRRSGTILAIADEASRFSKQIADRLSHD